MHPALDVLDASRSPADMRKDPQTLALVETRGGAERNTNPEDPRSKCSPLLSATRYSLNVATDRGLL